MRRVSPMYLVLLMPTLACVSRPLGYGDDDTQTSSESESPSPGTETETGETETETETETDTDTGTTDTETGDTETGETETETETETDTDTETETGTDTEALGECGNGIVEADEECDDGNDWNLDSCVEGCLLPVCGDGFHAAGEECDDGNAVDDDLCRNSCEWNVDPLCDDESLPLLEFENRNYMSDGPEGVQLCDRSGVPNQSPDWVGPGWYRYGMSGIESILWNPPEDYACGGTAGGWLNSPYPAVADGPTDVEICFALGLDECAWSVDAVLINCWYQPDVMWLPEVPDCDLRYCMVQIFAP